MSKNFQRVEDVIADSMFLDWYFKESANDINAWEQWLQGNPQYQSLVAEAIAWMNNLPSREKQVSSMETEVKWKQLQNLLNENETPVVSIVRQRRRWWIGAAAAILIIAAGITFLKWDSNKSSISTEYGQVANNRLPDGSTMILNANSSAQLSSGWGEGKDREVWLNGEAFFEVTKTAQKSRFIVHTDNLDVIVTGTQFNVQHRDEKTSVLLTEGSVIIRTADGKELMMKPGDYVEMADRSIEKKEGKPDNVLAWRESMLSFDNTPLTDVAKVIRHHYGVPVTLADEQLASRSITGLMSNNNLDDLLKAIEMVTEVRVTRKDKEIIFSARN